MNVILITSDQQRYDSLGCYGSDFVSTPTIDSLAEDGFRFGRAYCANPVCSPSRLSLFTGKCIDRHGVYNCGINVPEDELLLTHRLKAHGYGTYHIGKLHFNHWFGGFEESIEAHNPDVWPKRYPEFTGPYYGFDHVEMSMGHTQYGRTGHYGCWAQEKLNELGIDQVKITPMSNVDFGGRAYEWNLPSEASDGAWIAERATEFIKSDASKQPFFLNLGFQDPHHPHILHRSKAETLQPDKIPLPHYIDGELDDKPPFFNTARKGWLHKSEYQGAYHVAGQIPGHDISLVSDEDARLGRAYYYGMAEQLDHYVGEIITSLKENGLYDDTMIIFTTDHGELLGDHGIWMKGPFMYEQLIRVPLIIKWPKQAYRGESDTLVSLTDVAPTILATLGLETPEDMDGVDFTPHVTGQSASPHGFITVHHVDDPKKIRVKTVVTSRYKLTFHYGQPYGELYDLADDPWEVQNLWSEDEFSKIKAELLSFLTNHSERLEKRLPRPYYV